MIIKTSGIYVKLYSGNGYDGKIFLDSVNIVDKNVDTIEVRMRVSMVFQKPNPFPKSIYENVAYSLRIRGEKSRSLIDEKVEQALQAVALWNEVKDRLKDLAFNLSGGQQQRLCIARALVAYPEVILFDEPTSALDPIATTKIENLMSQLKHKVTILVVTHSMQQAAILFDYKPFMYLGTLVEFAETKNVFANPQNNTTEDYLHGIIG